MNEKKDEFKEWVVSTFDKEAEQELRRLQEKEEKFEVPKGVKEAVFERLQEQLRERNERNVSRQEVEEDGNIVGRQNTEENDDNVDYRNVEEADDIINKLSPEDREALELGRKMMKAEIGATANDRKKSRGRKRPLKIYMALAAVIICVLAMGITSIGGPERVVRMVRQAVGDRDVEKTSRSKKVKVLESENEEEAYEEIRKNINTTPVRIVSVSHGLKFERMVYDKESQVTELLYKYGEKTIAYFINATFYESSFGIDVEDQVLKSFNKNVDGYNILVKEYKVAETSEHRCAATFEKDGINYYIIATMNSEKFDEILNNLIFSK